MQLRAVNIVPKMGALPLSHMGHRYDLMPVLEQLGGLGTATYVNLAPNKVFDVVEQQEVIAQQWGYPHINFTCFERVGDLLYKICCEHIFDKLNIVVGQDRVRWGERIVHGIVNRTFKEYESDLSNVKLNIVVPETYKLRGLSGTTMREAAMLGDFDCFRAHLGPMFNQDDTMYYFNKTREAVVDGIIPVRRAK